MSIFRNAFIGCCLVAVGVAATLFVANGCSSSPAKKAVQNNTATAPMVVTNDSNQKNQNTEKVFAFWCDPIVILKQNFPPIYFYPTADDPQSIRDCFAHCRNIYDADLQLWIYANAPLAVNACPPTPPAPPGTVDCDCFAQWLIDNSWLLNKIYAAINQKYRDCLISCRSTSMMDFNPNESILVKTENPQELDGRENVFDPVDPCICTYGVDALEYFHTLGGVQPNSR